MSFSISVGIPVDNIILITQLINKQGLSQVHSLFFLCTSLIKILPINFNNIWLLHLIHVKTDRKFTLRKKNDNFTFLSHTRKYNCTAVQFDWNDSIHRLKS